MRIIAGSLGGRNFSAPKNSRTHPMSDKARGGLFNALGDIEGLTLLDAFAGSGALGFEAVSRGASKVTAIDIDKTAVNEIKANIKNLRVSERIKAIQANASSWSDNNQDAKFDIVIAAPPYDDLQLKLLTKLTVHAKPGGLYILDWPASEQIPELANFSIVANHDYGDAQIIFYRS